MIFLTMKHSHFKHLFMFEMNNVTYQGKYKILTTANPLKEEQYIIISVSFFV